MSSTLQINDVAGKAKRLTENIIEEVESMKEDMTPQEFQESEYVQQLIMAATLVEKAAGIIEYVETAKLAAKEAADTEE
jgi:hypothetical protein